MANRIAKDVVHIVGHDMLTKDQRIRTPSTKEVEEIILLLHACWVERRDLHTRRKRRRKNLLDRCILDLDQGFTSKGCTSSTIIPSLGLSSDRSEIESSSHDEQKKSKRRRETKVEEERNPTEEGEEESDEESTDVDKPKDDERKKSDDGTR